MIKLFVMHTGEQLHTFIGHENWVRSLSMHPSGKYFYSAGDDKTIRLWDLQCGKEKKTIRDAHDHFISKIDFNPKYMMLASTGNDMYVKIWQMKGI